MNLSLYSGATGMQAQQLNLNVISNNIANVNTTGYKKNKIEFQDLLYQNPRQAGGQTGAGNVIPTGVEMGNGTKVVSTAKIFTQGQLTQTSEKMDVAIDGIGFFQVERPDGTEAYTRDGAFKVGPDGQITTADALPLAAGLQIDPEVFRNALTNELVTFGKETMQRKLSKTKTDAARNSLCMQIYQFAFEWCVKKINETIA